MVWHHHFGKIAARLVAGDPRSTGGRVRAGGDAGTRRPHADAGVHPVHHRPVRALYGRRRHLRARQPARHAAAQHGAAGDRHGPGGLDGHDGRRDADDPARDPRQRQPQAQDACDRVLHLPGRERRRRAHAAGRPAAVPRVPEGRGLLLADQAPAGADDRALRAPVAGVLPARLVLLPPPRRGEAGEARPDAGQRAAHRRQGQLPAAAGRAGCGASLGRLATEPELHAAGQRDRAAERRARCAADRHRAHVARSHASLRTRRATTSAGVRSSRWRSSSSRSS